MNSDPQAWADLVDPVDLDLVDLAVKDVGRVSADPVVKAADRMAMGPVDLAV